VFVVRDLTIEAGIRTLVHDARFTVQAGDKIGLVGRNGAGKTTLMRTLAGERSPVSGTIQTVGRVGYLSQESELPDLERRDATALERILAAREIGAMLRRIEDKRVAIEARSGDERDRLIRQHARLRDEFETRGGYAAEAEAKATAAALGIRNEELDQPVSTMSGGQRRRVELARILFAETDTLLLDEPTNHLDLDAKAWLMEYLAAHKGGLLVVSHDLPLLDESITSVLALEGEALDLYRGNYSFFLEERERRREQRERERRHQEERIAQLESTVRRFKGTTEKMAKRAKSMQTRADKLKTNVTEIGPRQRSVAVRFPQPDPSGRVPLEGTGLAKAFGDNLVFVDVDAVVERGERVLIMGLNGAGKTTLLKILAGVIEPDLGEVAVGHKATLGYYAQEHESIRAGASVLDHMRVASDQPDQMLRSVLGHFLLADKVHQDAGTLSGGEKTKTALAQLVLSRPNVLLLDEPTNNLDPQAKEALLDALETYEGTVVLVSHDTDFVASLRPHRAIMMPDGTSHYFDDDLLELVALA
jgi:ATPase subunit of ABC transporter with duplicated ATPase domains